MQIIDYLEFWATKHCNLNCKGCSSCSPISEEWYLQTEVLRKDLNRLNRLGISVTNINILGGEPLISPKLSAFNVNFGQEKNTACEGNDPRLSDAR